MIRDSDTLIQLQNFSRIRNVVANENAPRSFSSPDMIIMDEASRIEDIVYSSTRPQLVKNPNALLVILSTPFGKRGFFYRAWTSDKGHWRKIRVEVPYELRRTPAGLVVSPTGVPEKEFREYWAEQGVEAFYSPHHTQEFLQEELDEVGEYMWKQEYGVEFLDNQENLFDLADLEAAMRTGSQALFQDEPGQVTGASKALTF